MIKAQCRNGHAPEMMSEDHMRKLFFCGLCGQSVTPGRIYQAAPETYRPSGELFLATLQGLLDYEIMGVVLEGGRLTIEYPRKGDL